VKAGWGDWAGPGAMEVSQKIMKRRDKMMIQIQKENELQRMERKDYNKQQVILSERRSKAAAKYKVTDIPYPFTSREEYERSLQMPLGEEWNAMHVVGKLTEPELKTRAGRIIEPIALPKGKQRTQDEKSNSKPNKKARTS
jgi:U3 small nucleolar RNA-associated protein 14